MLSIAGMCCCGFLAAATAISGSSAYQTDHDEVVNIIQCVVKPLASAMGI